MPKEKYYKVRIGSTKFLFTKRELDIPRERYIKVFGIKNG